MCIKRNIGSKKYRIWQLPPRHVEFGWRDRNEYRKDEPYYKTVSSMSIHRSYICQYIELITISSTDNYRIGYIGPVTAAIVL